MPFFIGAVQVFYINFLYEIFLLSCMIEKQSLINHLTMFVLKGGNLVLIALVPGNCIPFTYVLFLNTGSLQMRDNVPGLCLHSPYFEDLL